MGRVCAIAVVLLVVVASEARAHDPDSWMDRFEVSGWLESIQSLGVSEPHETITSRARMRLNVEADFDYLYACVSGDAEKNWKIDGQSGVDLHELWVEHAQEGWDMRLGRQTIIWGKADGVQVTDVICPPDYTESITRDLDEIRIPVDAAKFRLLGSETDVEFLWIPVFEAAVLPEGDNPWAPEIKWPAGIDVVQKKDDKPDVSLENSELAMRVSSYLPGFDFSVSAFYTWDDYAANHRSFSVVAGTPTITFSPKHHRMMVLGFDLSRPWSDFVFRSEVAGYLGRYFETKSLAVQPIKKNAVKWLAGVDWTPGNDWTVIGQIMGEEILGYERSLAGNQHDLTTTLHISKKLLRQTLTLSGMLYYNLNDDDSIFRAKADYELVDGFHLLLGADLFNGDRKGRYGRYDDNSQVWFKAKYSF